MSSASETARQVGTSNVADCWEEETVDAAQVANRLIDVSTRIATSLDKFLARRQLHRGEFDVLAALHQSGQPSELTPSALAAMTTSSRAAMTGRLDHLEAAELIRRIRDRGDRRSIKVVLTSAGAHLAQQSHADFAAGAQKALGAVGADGVRHLDPLLRALRDGME